MTFKKHNWIPYGQQDIVIEVRLKENFGRDLDFFRCNKQDFKRIKDILRQKYGIE